MTTPSIPGRRGPRPIAHAIDAWTAAAAPATALARIQSAWRDAVGSTIAAEASPVAERDGVVRVTCRSAVWAQELDLMGPELVERLNAALGAPMVRNLRCSAAPTRGERRP